MHRIKTREECEEQPVFVELARGPFERWRHRAREELEQSSRTGFGKNQAAMEEVGRVLQKLKGQGEVVINNIGPGVAERNGVKLMGKEIMGSSISYETFELLNQAKKAGIDPKKLVIFVMDINRKVLEAVDRTKTLKMHTVDTYDRMHYFRDFFNGFHGKEKDFITPVGIPGEYRDAICCLEPLDIMKTPAPVKADVTFSYVYEDKPGFLKNLVESTKKGGYIFCIHDYGKGLLDELGLEKIGAPKGARAVYRVK